MRSHLRSACSACLAICLLLAAPLLAQTAAPPAPPLATRRRTWPVSSDASFKLDPSIPAHVRRSGWRRQRGSRAGGNQQHAFAVAGAVQLQGRGSLSTPTSAPEILASPRNSRFISTALSLLSDCLRLASAAGQVQAVSKFVLINTPFESAKIVNLRLKKKNIQAIEAVDRTTLHALVFWDGKRWRWSAQGMDGDDTMFKTPPPN